MGLIGYFLTFVLVATLVRGDLPEEKQEANIAASLKPLPRITGTNLFLNTLYKWHDSENPGCFVTWLAESKKLMTVCNKDDQKLYDTPSSDWILEIVPGIGYLIGGNSDVEYNGTIGFKNVGAKAYVDIANFDSNRMIHELTVDTSDPATRQAITFINGMFLLNSAYCKNNNLRIANKGIGESSYYLFQKPADNYRSDLCLTNAYLMSCSYSFVPAIKIDVLVSNFQFTRPPGDELAKHTSQKGLIDAYVINNNSSGVISRTVKVSEKVKNEFSWGLSQKLSVGSKIKGKAGIPLVAEGEVEASFEFEAGATQDWSNSIEKSFEMSYDVKVEPNTQVEISAWYDLIKGISMDYTATFEITGKTSRITVFDDIVEDTPASGLMIRSHLELSNFDGEIVEIKEDRVIARYKGTMTASVGVRGRLNVNGSTVLRST